MKTVLANFKIQLNEKIYVKDPESSVLGKKIIKESILLIDEMGFEKFTHPRIVSDIQLVFKITKSLSFTTQFASTLDYLPIVTGNVFTYNLSGSFFLKLKD